MDVSPTPTLNSAIELKKAVDRASRYLKPIGFCPSALNRRQRDLGVEKNPYSRRDMLWTYKAENDKELMTRLRKIEEMHTSPCANGYLDAPFSLTVAREGCEFSGKIFPKNQGSKKEVAVRLKNMEKLLKKWFESGAESGYGDVRTQTTKIDKSVRDAREILASEFSVEPQLLEMIKKHWAAAHFYPAMVRVEPYKIHLYGPGGKFAKHRDTPETDLVGTFLVGLGHFVGLDHLGEERGLSVRGFHGWEFHKSHPGYWIAFHPDIQHEVIEIKDGYRAVIAFKIFRLSGVQEDPEDSEMRSKIRDIFEKMPRKFGMLLEHKYCTGTTKLSGFDAELLAAAKSMLGVDIFVLPVLTEVDVEVYNYNTDEPELTDLNKMKAKVYPHTEPHIKALIQIPKRNRTKIEENKGDKDEKDNLGKEDNLDIKDNSDKEVDSDKEGSSDEEDNSEEKIYSGSDDEDNLSEEEEHSSFFDDFLKGTEAAWIKERDVHNVPFFSQDVESNTMVWHADGEDGAEHVGNEARPTSEDSVYISYAMIVLPKTGTKRKREIMERPADD